MVRKILLICDGCDAEALQGTNKSEAWAEAFIKLTKHNEEGLVTDSENRSFDLCDACANRVHPTSWERK